MSRAFFAGMVLIASSAAVAQTTEPAAVPTVAPAQIQRLLPPSTLVSVTPDSEYSSKRLEMGQKLSFSVVNDVVEQGNIAIPRGSKVEATVTFKTGKAIGGKSGKFEVSFDKITVRGASYAMRGTHRQEGKGNTVAAVFGSMLVSGRSAVMRPGDLASAFTADQIPY